MLVHHTNETFANFLEELFKRFGHGDLMSVVKISDPGASTRYQITFKYKELLNLDPQDKLYKFLQRSAERNKDMIVRGLVEVE